MYELREMTIKDYEMSFKLWSQAEGIALSEADSRESINKYLNRNVGMSFVCEVNGNVIGTILCGHDGRRGYIYHVAVLPEFRGKSIAQKLVKSSLSKLKLEGISKCHLMVIADNEIGNRFWDKIGWLRREGILLYSRDT